MSAPEPQSLVNTRPCPICQGKGCSECDHKGSRYAATHYIDGATLLIHGSGDRPPEGFAEDLALLSRAAMTKWEGGS